MDTAAWNDLFVRTDVREKGPDVRRGGFSSPDIIPVGTKLVNPGEFATAASYDRYYQQAFYKNAPNYVFVRAKNSSTSEPASGTARMVMCDPAVVLWPGGEGWTPIKTASGSDHSDLLDVGPGEIGVTGDGGEGSSPFVVVPTESGHRCLVTWVSTQKHPAKAPPRIETAGKLAEYLVNNPNYAHHNIDVLVEETTRHLKQYAFTSGEVAADWVFMLTVKGCRGYEVAFSCGTPLDDGSYIKLEPQVVGTDAEFSYTIDRKVQGGFASTIDVFLNQRNLPLTDSFNFAFKASLAFPPGHPYFDYGVPYHTWDDENGLTPSANRAFELGSVAVIRARA